MSADAVASCDARIAELIVRAGGEAPPREAMSALRDERSEALFIDAQRSSDLLAAEKALAAAEAAAPSEKQVAAWQREIADGIEKHREAVAVLTDSAFVARVDEIRRLLGDAPSLGGLVGELRHIDATARGLLRVFNEGNSIGRGWWAGDEIGND